MGNRAFGDLHGQHESPALMVSTRGVLIGRLGLLEERRGSDGLGGMPCLSFFYGDYLRDLGVGA